MKLNKEEIITKIKKFLKEIWNECKDIKTVILLIIVMIIMYMPIWGGYLLYYYTKKTWALVVATSMLTFWAGPFTPFFPLCIFITLFIKRHFFNKGKLGDK
ncbi:MAG: hypothetical protein Q4F88_03135 [Eubacteriales bacterium]|nr:hypothetical protein [Eubacteriales bacterium]